MVDEIFVIGVGNEFRGDDAVGLLVVRSLEEKVLPGITVTEICGEGSELIAAWEGQESVILIDAAQSGAEPGTIHRFEAHIEALPAESFHFSSHAFSVLEAIEIARSLGQLPSKVIVYGIEGMNFNLGSGVSSSVQKSVDKVIKMIIREIG